MSADEPAVPLYVRLFDPERDFPALVNLINAIEAVDQSGEATTEDQQRAQIAWPGRDLAQDRCVVLHPDDPQLFLGFSDSWKSPTTPTADMYVGVHPAWRRRGLGSDLLQRALMRARAQGAADVAIYAEASNHASQMFLHRHGFTRIGAFAALQMTLPPVLEAPQWPIGYTLYHFSEKADIASLVAVLNQSYGDLFGHKLTNETTIQRWLDAEASQNILLLADERQAVVGICRVRPTRIEEDGREAPIGYLDAPGLVPNHRHIGLYRSLVLAGIALLRVRGHTAIVLESWGDNEGVIDAYCELGFTRQRHFVAYRYSIA
jgi:mycothiol synthase